MELLDRFLKYVSFPTNSDEDSLSCPSTAKQLALAAYLKEELETLGLQGVTMTEKGYVYAALPAQGTTAAPAIGFIAHMDTSSAAPDAPIRPRVLRYEGGEILLNEATGAVMDPETYPCLTHYLGHRLIVTDGGTLLGADDKAGVAEIVTMAERLKNSDRPHGPVKLAFTPDEEVGRGVDFFDVELFGADYAYTVDGGPFGGLEYECFNAASALVEIRGLSIHPGAAKGTMMNAALYACEFASLLPEKEIPAETEGYEGFYHLARLEGNAERAELRYILRDFDREGLERRKETMLAAARAINERHGAELVTVTIRDSYRNMREEIEKHMEIVDRAKEALRQMGTEPVVTPVRGGTDGARLTFMGLPCPNLCTGGQNYHSRYEFASLDEMEKCAELLCRIVWNAAQ